MDITLKLKNDVARALHARAPHTAASKNLVQYVASQGIELSPIHPGTEDSELELYFRARVEDEVTERIRDELERIDAVESAYVKPSEGLP